MSSGPKWTPSQAGSASIPAVKVWTGRGGSTSGNRRTRLQRWCHLPPGGGEPGPDDPPLEEPIVEEYTIEASGGTTVLRMVNSGIPESAEWDAFYDGTDVGWDGFFLALRHDLTYQAGRPRNTCLWIMAPFTDRAEVGWERLTDALANSGKLSELLRRRSSTTSPPRSETICTARWWRWTHRRSCCSRSSPGTKGSSKRASSRHPNTDTPPSPSRCGATRRRLPPGALGTVDQGSSGWLTTAPVLDPISVRQGRWRRPWPSCRCA